MQNAHLGKNRRLEIGSSSFELFFSQTFFVTNFSKISSPPSDCAVLSKTRHDGKFHERSEKWFWLRSPLVSYMNDSFRQNTSNLYNKFERDNLKELIEIVEVLG